MAQSYSVLVHLCVECGMLTNIKLHFNRLTIPGEFLAARYNSCQDPAPSRGPAVEKHCPLVLSFKNMFVITTDNFYTKIFLTLITY